MTLTLNNLSVSDSSNNTLIAPLSLTISSGEIVSFMGPSGCGKSTLLNMIAGHYIRDFHYTGEIYLHDQLLNTVAIEQRKIGMLFQDDLLFPHLNIWQNLAIALPNTIKGGQRKQQVMDCLDEMDLSSLAEHAPSQISGGQRARIAMMRLLLAKPQAVLLDEPFNKLDKSLRTNFRNWVFEQIQQREIPAIMVTHDQDDLPLNGQVLHWPWQDTKGEQNA